MPFYRHLWPWSYCQARFTVGMPTVIVPPHAHKSPTRAAGRPRILTFALPVVMALGGCPGGTGNAHTCWSPTTAAASPAIRTFGTQGPVIIPGCAVGEN